MYHINQNFIDEMANLDINDLDEWGSRILNAIEEQETKPTRHNKEHKEQAEV